NNLTENFSVGEKEQTKSQTINCCDLTSFLLGTAVAQQFCMEAINLTAKYFRDCKQFCENCLQKQYPQPVYNPVSEQFSAYLAVEERKN
ncbi:17101_t:CDS:2, partial [Racocetra fulgida]